MHKIYLVSPYIEFKYTTPHLSLEYIKFYLMDFGYEVEIVDCTYYKSLDDVISKLSEGENPIIGLTAYTRERFHAYKFIRKVKENIPDSLIVVGGRHFSSLSEETLKELPMVDIVVRGEGEITFKEICDYVYRNTNIKEILGISYRSGAEIIHNPDRPLESNIDKFRYFDKNYLPDPKRYLLAGSFQRMANSEMKFFEVMATRGCPNSCVFCSLKADKARYRSIDNIIKEIEEKIEITGVRNVKFIDSSLTINKKFVVELCDRIITKKLNIKWVCYSRVASDFIIAPTHLSGSNSHKKPVSSIEEYKLEENNIGFLSLHLFLNIIIFFSNNKIPNYQYINGRFIECTDCIFDIANHRITCKIKRCI